MPVTSFVKLESFPRRPCGQWGFVGKILRPSMPEPHDKSQIRQKPRCSENRVMRCRGITTG